MRHLLIPFLAIWGLFHSAPTPYSAMIDRVESSVVRVTGEKDMGDDKAKFVCTGFVIAPNQVLTAAHCLGENLKADGIDATVLKLDDGPYDLMLLGVVTGTRPALVFRDAPVFRFENLTAIGYAFGWPRLSAMAERALIVSMAPYKGAAVGLLLQPGYIGGMSGGPVVDSYGHVVGIVQQSNAGIGYGVETLLIRAFLLGV